MPPKTLEGTKDPPEGTKDPLEDEEEEEEEQEEEEEEEEESEEDEDREAEEDAEEKEACRKRPAGAEGKGRGKGTKRKGELEEAPKPKSKAAAKAEAKAKGKAKAKATAAAAAAAAAKAKAKAKVKAEQQSPSRADAITNSQLESWRTKDRRLWNREDKRAAKAAYVRSTDPAKGLKDVPSKMPEDLRQRYEDDPKGMFNLWCDSKQNWKGVRLAIQAKTTQKQRHKGKKRWMRKDEIEKEFPKEVAVAKMNYLKAMPGCFQVDPQAPDCEAGWLWHIRTTNEDSSEDERQLDITMSGTGEVEHSNPMAGAIISRISQRIEAGSAVRLPQEDASVAEQTPEEKRAAEDEQQRLTEEREAKRLLAEEKKNTPSEKAKAWLSKFAADQAACLSLIAKSTVAIQGMKDPLRLEYNKIFTDVASKMDDACKGIQKYLANQTVDPTEAFETATEIVGEFKREKKAFDRCIESYERKDKDGEAPPAGKKKRKKAKDA